MVKEVGVSTQQVLKGGVQNVHKLLIRNLAFRLLFWLCGHRGRGHPFFKELNCPQAESFFGCSGLAVFQAFSGSTLFEAFGQDMA
jgi:hypothetical protein